LRNKDNDKNLKVGPKIEDMLDDLINKFGMNTKILSKALGVESFVIDNYSKYKDTMSMSKYGPFKGLLATLYSIPEINPDERNKAVINYLIKIHNIDMATIADFAHVKIRDIYDFMKDSNSVSFEVKYKISSVSMFLHFLFKPEEDAQ
jgi:hypothetical protein